MAVPAEICLSSGTQLIRQLHTSAMPTTASTGRLRRATGATTATNIQYSAIPSALITAAGSTPLASAPVRVPPVQPSSGRKPSPPI